MTNNFPVKANATAGPGGITGVSRLLSAAASVNATVVKAGQGRLYRAFGLNAAAATRYLKFYNKATAPAATDTPVLTIAIPASGAFNFDLGGDVGVYFSAGIGYRLTTGVADNDTAALTAADILGLNVTYL